MKKITFLKMIVLSLVTIFSFTLYSCKGVSDSDIQKEVTAKLSSTPGVTADVKDGVVTLSGQCSDEASKAMCETEAKSVKGVKSVVNNCTVAPPVSSAPVTVSPDDALSTSVRDAVKDFEGVNATVTDGVVTLTGTIKRTRLPNLMQSLNTLKPKKITNQLTIQ